MESQDTLVQYLELFEQAKRRVDDPVVAAQLVTEVGKDRRVAMMHNRPAVYSVTSRPQNGTNQAATSKQLAYLRRLNIEIPAGLTSKQASALLDEAEARVAAR